MFRNLGLKNRGAGKVEGTMAITVTGGRIDITGPEETIGISVTGVWI